uniref:NADH-ubiquinone oxidoreductase chain 1 n=1 Tax=Euaspis polynesia TaxID=1352276 RepID=A0A7T5BM38_9HYME|nr:NADH dehydrogenase subunit 1 [Euaspis polynesia]QQD78168.1 NADH dehydrogenase subunit 1 [Euaspis polynesia]
MLYLLLMLVMMLISMAFLTLLERKILGYIHCRKGPNKVGLMGLIQPFSDAMKLFSKEFYFLMNVNYLYYLISPMLMILISLIYWFNYPYMNNLYKINYNLIYFMVLLSLGVYPFMFGGWSSNSIYSMLGCLRVIAQSISFEVSVFFMMYLIFMYIENFNIMSLMKFQYSIKFVILFFPLYLMFVISMMIELNRAPFDLIEGESELVSGFNIEYHSSLFSMIFMAEYLMILFLSFIITFLFFNFMFSILTLLFLLIHIYFMIWIRSIMPRIRYDELMYMCWKKILVMLMIYIINMFILKMCMLMLI